MNLKKNYYEIRFIIGFLKGKKEKKKLYIEFKTKKAK